MQLQKEDGDVFGARHKYLTIGHPWYSNNHIYAQILSLCFKALSWSLETFESKLDRDLSNLV